MCVHESRIESECRHEPDHVHCAYCGTVRVSISPRFIANPRNGATVQHGFLYDSTITIHRSQRLRTLCSTVLRELAPSPLLHIEGFGPPVDRKQLPNLLPLLLGDNIHFAKTADLLHDAVDWLIATVCGDVCDGCVPCVVRLLLLQSGRYPSFTFGSRIITIASSYTHTYTSPPPHTHRPAQEKPSSKWQPCHS